MHDQIPTSGNAGGRRWQVFGRLRPGLLAALLGSLPAACAVLPAEWNLSPLYRHRKGPDGRLLELDILWPLVHWERTEGGGSDFRLRPLWRRLSTADGSRVEHQFLVPFGRATSDDHETFARLIPLFWYREHEAEGRPGAYDIDWWFTPLVWGGASSAGENYLAFFPLFGTLRNFLTYDRFTFFLFPLYLSTRKGDLRGTHILWPLIGWGGGENPDRPHWWRFLPFYGRSETPGRRRAQSLLWPFFHWGAEALDSKDPVSYLAFFPLFGLRWNTAFSSWYFLWPFFRHTGGKAPGGGRAVSWDVPWPILRWRRVEGRSGTLRQWWFMPLVASTATPMQQSLLLLFPLIWSRRFHDRRTQRRDFWFVPFFRDVEIAERKKPGRAYRNLRLWPLYRARRLPAGSWSKSFPAPWPYDGGFATGVEEAWDWAWTLVRVDGDGRGNRRTRTFADLYTSRSFASGRFQCSIPFLFSYLRRADGSGVFRLFQVLPFSFGASNGARG